MTDIRENRCGCHARSGLRPTFLVYDKKAIKFLMVPVIGAIRFLVLINYLQNSLKSKIKINHQSVSFFKA